MKKFLSVFLVFALTFTIAQYIPPAVAAENKISAFSPEADIVSSFSQNEDTEENQSYCKTNRFFIRGLPMIEIGDVLGNVTCKSVKPLQTNCTELAGYLVIELDEEVYVDGFIAAMQETGAEAYPNIALGFASIDLENTETVMPAFYDLQQNLTAAQTVAAGSDVVIALLDNGVDLFHKDIQEHLIDGWDFFHDSSNVAATGASFGEGHGTHIAGTIAAVAPNAKIMPLQISEDGIAYASTVIEAIKYAEDHGAAIANCSWTTEEYSPLLESAMKNSSLFFVVAAGNNRTYVNKTPVYPASFKLENVISVTSVNEDGQLSYFSNYGSDIDIAAWGDEVEGALPGDSYGKLSGTSMSAAYISGAAALAISSGVNASELKFHLKECADKIENMEGFISDGNILNINNVVHTTTSGKKVSIHSSANYSSSTVKAVDVAAGSSHYSVLMSNGEVWSWGDNSAGQLGIGTRVDQKVPFKIPGTMLSQYMYDKSGEPEEHAHLFAGSHNTFFVSPAGKVFGWGMNNLNQIYPIVTPSSTYETAPLLSLITQVKDIAVGGNFVLFRMFSGNIFRTGCDLGYKTGTPVYRAQPAVISDFPNCAGIAAGDQVACVLTDTGDAYAWGTLKGVTVDAGYEQIYEPMLLESSIRNIAAGGSNVALIGERYNSYVTSRPYTSRIHNKYLFSTGAAYSDVVQTACNTYVEAYLDSAGQVWVTGYNNSWGQAGHGTIGINPISAESNTPVPGLSNIVKVDAGTAGVIALQDDGTVWVWGDNSHGQLGNGSSASYSTLPVKVVFPKTYREIARIEDIEAIEVNYDTPAENLALPSSVYVDLTNGILASIPVEWDLSTYDSQKVEEAQVITGQFILPDDVLNPLELVPQIEVTVLGAKKRITSVTPLAKEINQNIWLAPTDKTHTFGIPDTVALPDMVTVTLNDNSTAQLPVEWHTEGYEPALIGTQTLLGEIIISDEDMIENPDHIQASLEITVVPRQYEVWEASPMEISAEIMTGSTIAEINEQLKKAGKSELHVRAIDLTSELEVLTYCDIIINAEDNPSYQNIKDIPGTYQLNARLPENFIPLADDIPGPITVTVTSAPVDIVSTKTVHMSAPQSFASKALTGIPTEVTAVLENGYEIPIEVEWNWSEYDLSKDTVGEHIVLGTLKNLPSSVQQPADGEVMATMIVDVFPVNYQISKILSDNFFEGDAGFSLEELTALIKPTLTVEIVSTDHEPKLTTEYEVDVALQTEKNSSYNSECADIYILSGTFNLPANISRPQNISEEIILQTNAVEIESVEVSYAVALEGTAFSDIKGLPDQVFVLLSSHGVDGLQKSILCGVDWGTGEGYSTTPTDWQPDGTATMDVTGTLVDYPQYVNGAGKQAHLFVTVTEVYDLIEISPARIPETETLDVKLGSTLEDIYAQLDTHSVMITIKNRRELSSSTNVTFQLREEDNPAYDPMTLDTYTLKAYLPLDEAARNPNALELEIAVRTMKYNITNTKAVRITGVESGTPFEEVGLPSLATVVRNDEKTEDVPVTWNGSNYNPTKIGSQIVRGTLNLPLPIHLENPNGRQPNAVVTIVDPSAIILSLEALPSVDPLALDNSDIPNIFGLKEYRYCAEILHADGTITTEIISAFIEIEE